MHCRRQSREIKDRGQSVLEIGKQPSPPFERVVAMKICNINKAVDALKAKAFLPGPFLCGGETPTSEPLLLNSKRPLCHQGPNCYFQTRDGQTHVPILLSLSAQLLVTFAPSALLCLLPSLHRIFPHNKCPQTRSNYFTRDKFVASECLDSRPNSPSVL